MLQRIGSQAGCLCPVYICSDTNHHPNQFLNLPSISISLFRDQISRHLLSLHLNHFHPSTKNFQSDPATSKTLTLNSDDLPDQQYLYLHNTPDHLVCSVLPSMSINLLQLNISRYHLKN